MTNTIETIKSITLEVQRSAKSIIRRRQLISNESELKKVFQSSFGKSLSDVQINDLICKVDKLENWRIHNASTNEGFIQITYRKPSAFIIVILSLMNLVSI